MSLPIPLAEALNLGLHRRSIARNEVVCWRGLLQLVPAALVLLKHLQVAHA